MRYAAPFYRPMSGGLPHLLEESAVASVTAKETPSAEQDLLSAEFSTTCAGGSVAPEALPLWLCGRDQITLRSPSCGLSRRHAQSAILVANALWDSASGSLCCLRKFKRVQDVVAFADIGFARGAVWK